MKVAIIGGAGFIGSAIAKYLKEQNADIYIFDTHERLLKNSHVLNNVKQIVFPYPKIQKLEGLLKGYDSIIHLSYTTEPSTSMNSISKDAEENIIPSIKLIEEAIKSGVKKIIFSSSGGTIYGSPENIPVKEGFAKKPISAYGLSKYTIENYINFYSKYFPITGISLRLANPYGEYQIRGTTIGIIAHYLNLINKGNEIVVWGDGTTIRDYIHIDCVAKAFVSALFSKELPSGSYNIGTGIGISINDLIDLLFKITNKKVPVIYKTNRIFDVDKISLDYSLFKSFTNWEPEITLYNGIINMWKQL